jgi:aminoglycoside phosphotransferase (APT) family kinase protein
MLGRQRDVEHLHAALTAWLRRTRADDDLVLAPLTTPKAGISNETFLVEARSRAGAERLVLRIAPTDFLVFPEYDLVRQARVMQALARSPVPVPRVLRLERDARHLGAPFYVMEHVEGEVPSEVPPYHAFGLCLDATPDRRARMWWSGIAALAAIHAVDWRARDLAFLGVPGPGSDPLDRQLAYWEAYLRWMGGPPQPILETALAWLRAHRYTPRRVSLCWGDSRLPNLLFRDDAVVGVLDWEMAFLGDPEADLGWWLFMDWASSEGYGFPRLAGLPDAGETVRRYEELTGVPVERPLYQDVFAGLRFGAIMARIAGRLREIGAPAPTEDFETNNVATQRLAAVLGLPPPGERV